MKYTNFLLTVIAGLLALVAYELHLHRPVTLDELSGLSGEALEARRAQIPLVRVDGLDTDDESDGDSAEQDSGPVRMHRSEAKAVPPFGLLVSGP
ncbi:hypothetical protein [Xylophilus sp. ASV27]|uniref:hypothetical protein n=1 Tax=Xylophilus sp. ASV27 TaxID=2795129 RepID=UPI0018EBB947|nr:hypothetical protein [Xylophilus sp. ASV27]